MSLSFDIEGAAKAVLAWLRGQGVGLATTPYAILIVAHPTVLRLQMYNANLITPSVTCKISSTRESAP
jgi:hypothetical protein